MKRILVTGGFGFIGMTLVEKLMATDDAIQVHIVDDLSSSPLSLGSVRTPSAISDFITGIVCGNEQSIVTFDLMTVDDFFSRIAHWVVPFDEIYHLASPVGPASVIKQGGTMVGTVVRDIYSIIDYCLAHNTKLLDVSTSEVYGGGDKDGLCSENTPKIFQPRINMRMEYAVAKFAAETAIINTHTVKELKAVIIRPFNVAGPRQSARGGFVIPRFVQQAVCNVPYTVFGDGNAIRSFTHVSDICDGIILAMKVGKSGRAYNLGNPHNKTTINELAACINEVLGISNKIDHVDPKKIYGDYYESAHDKFPDSSLAQTDLGWIPSLDTRTIIRDYYTEYNRRRECGILEHEVIDANSNV